MSFFIFFLHTGLCIGGVIFWSVVVPGFLVAIFDNDDKEMVMIENENGSLDIGIIHKKKGKRNQRDNKTYFD